MCVPYIETSISHTRTPPVCTSGLSSTLGAHASRRKGSAMISRLLAYTLLGLLLFVGFQVWSKRHAALPPPLTPPAAAPPAPASAASPNPQLSVTLSDPAAQPIVRHSGTPLTIPVKVSGSPHAAALNEINALIQQGKDADAEAKLKTLRPDALNEPRARASTAPLWHHLGVMRVKARG